MKLYKIVLISLLFGSFSLVACTPDSSSKEDGSSIHNSLPVESLPIDNSNQRIQYSLTITGETHLLASEPHQPSTDMVPASYSYYPGDWVVFGVSKVMDADVIVKLNGEKLETHQESSEIYYYQFYMPEMDSVIDISIAGGI